MQKDIDKNFETKYKGSFATEWQSFIEKYQKTLKKSSKSDDLR
jgi:uncharacterized protein